MLLVVSFILQIKQQQKKDGKKNPRAIVQIKHRQSRRVVVCLPLSRITNLNQKEVTKKDSHTHSKTKIIEAPAAFKPFCTENAT